MFSITPTEYRSSARCGSKPVSAVRKAMRRTFFCASAGNARAARKARRSTNGRKRIKGGSRAKSNNYNGLPGVTGGVGIDVRVPVGLVQDGVLSPSLHPGL